MMLFHQETSVISIAVVVVVGGGIVGNVSCNNK